jgi:hypothetical protein
MILAVAWRMAARHGQNLHTNRPCHERLGLDYFLNKPSQHTDFKKCKKIFITFCKTWEYSSN